MGSESNKQPDTETTGSPSPTNGDAVSKSDAIDERSRTPRHPRWTREETFVLIQAKMAVEERVQRGHRPTLGFGSEPKWESVASYCKENGVNRESVQCRKRWSNLVGDFKKIKTWESQGKGEAEWSFWMMRNDMRKLHKLPGFFDREVYDVLEGKPITIAALPLTVLLPLDSKEEEEAEAVFDSARANEDGLFSEEEAAWSQETPPKTLTTPSPVSDKQPQTFSQEKPEQDTVKEKNPTTNSYRESVSEERWKRRRVSSSGSEDGSYFGNKLINILQRNSNMLNAHFEAQNVNCQLERDQQKKQTDIMVSVLGKLTDALVRIADKL